MECEELLLQVLDSAAREFRFPIWAYNKDYAFTGALRLLGFASDSESTLVFERVDFDFRDGSIASIANCFSTSPSIDWYASTNGIFVPSDQLMDPDTGNFRLGFGTLRVESRGKFWDITLDRHQLIRDGYLEPKAERLTEAALLFRICDSIPQDWLFDEPNHIREIFGLNPNSRQLFALYQWEHPSNEFYKGDADLSRYPDIRAMVTAVCSGNSSPKLKGIPNTSWRIQWPKYQSEE